MTLTAPAPASAAVRRGRGAAARRPASLVVHVLALSVVLLGLWATGPRGHGFTDDGIALSAQVEALAGGSWTAPHPYPAADPAGEHHPDRMAGRVAGTDRYTSYWKHPVAPLVLVPGWALAGEAGVELVVLAGLVAAAVAVSRVVEEVAPTAARAAFWLVGCGSVLVVHGFVLWLHAWALAAAAIAVTATLRLLDPGRGGPRIRPLLTLLAALATGMLLRTEGALLGAALAVGLASAGLRPGRRHPLAVAAAVVAVTAAVLAGEDLLIEALVGPLVEPTAPPGAGWLADRVSGSTLVFLLGALHGPAAAVRSAAVVLLLGVGVLVRRGASGRPLWAIVAAAAALYGWSVIEMVPSPVPGILPALPILVAPLLLPTSRRPPCVGPLLVAAAAYVALVAVTVHAGGGGSDWGGRYVVMAVPLLAPIVADRLVRLDEVLDRRDARALRLGLLVVTLAGALPIHGELTDNADTARQARTAILAEAATVAPPPGSGRAVVVVQEGHVARLLSLDHASISALRVTEAGDVGPLVDRLGQDGATEVLLVTRSAAGASPAGALPPGWRAGPIRHLTPNLDAVTLRSGRAGSTPPPAGRWEDMPVTGPVAPDVRTGR